MATKSILPAEDTEDYTCSCSLTGISRVAANGSLAEKNKITVIINASVLLTHNSMISNRRRP